MKHPIHYLHSANKAFISCLFVLLLLSATAIAQPGNDDCSGATSLTSSNSCNNNQYNMKNATASASIPVGCAAGGTHYDVWFRFTAASTSHTVTISNLQNNFTNPEIQLFSGTCASLTSVVCGTTTMTSTGLTSGSTYYIRVSNIGSSISSQGKFDICVTHPPAVPTNDDCANAILLTSGTSCSSITSNMYYATNSSPTGTCGGATATTTYDVWFRFQATATTQTVTLGSLGSRLTAASTNMQMLSGTCGRLTSLACQTASTRMTVGSLTIGAYYYVSIYVVLSPTGGTSGNWNFDICVQQPPANDECTGAITLTPGATCTNVAGTLDLATVNAATSNACFGAGTYYDVWYRFTATAASHTITLSGLGSSFTNSRIQIFSGTCGVLVSVGCTPATATAFTQAGLLIGTTYFVRIANATTNPSGTGTVANFNICITAAPAPPSNDLCTGAILLTSGTTCSNISGTLIRATATAILPLCGDNASPEVWYSFVAQSAYPTITLGSIGANLNTAGPRIQLFSGTCGSLTSLACTTNPLSVLAAVGGAGLTVGTTYYVRITTLNLSSPVTTGTYTFNICVTDPIGAIVDYAKSYVNVTDGIVGGTINTGDVLEIRATLVIQRNGSPLALRSIDSVGFYDTLKAGRGFAMVPNSISTKTNEGKLYKSFTDIFDTDAGWYTTAGAGTDTTIRINMGIGATNTRRGKLRSSSPPSFYSNTCIIMATYRVTVNAALGTAINFGGGAFSYRDTLTGVFYTINFPNDSLIISQDLGLCPNTVSVGNILGDEFNGTFGVPSGSPAYPQNRGTSPNTNYAYATFAASSPQDYFYGIANNTSAAGSTAQTLAKSNAARVHGVWDITGDHTGAANTARGNNPCNLSAPISSTNPCGYMLVVNAAYRTDLAFNFSVTGACPNTYYEISAWLKNVCYKCGCDSLGRGSGTAGYIPTAPGDTSGVRPNIAFQINGIDYYTTGDIVYQGLGGTQTGSDTLNNWVKRGFVYKTGPTENSFTLTLRNNAPGGGGNDWALDDLSLRTCLPNMSYSPTNSPAVCANNVITISDTVRSYFNTYIEYKWQRSTDGGVVWTDIAGTTSTATPVWNGTAYQYIATYTIPVGWTTGGNDGDLYRVVVASTTGNLASETCNFSDPTTITLDVLTNCVPILGTDLLSVSGKLIVDKARISWVTSKEQDPIRYSVEKSFDGIRFTSIAIVDGYYNGVSEKNYYTYDDPQAIAGTVFYRIAVLNNQTVKKYSQTITLSLDKLNNWEMGTVINPFYNELQYGISSPVAAVAKIELVDNYGKTIKTASQHVNSGSNAFVLSNTEGVPAGIYLLKVTINGNVAIRKVMKGYR